MVSRSRDEKRAIITNQLGVHSKVVGREYAQYVGNDNPANYQQDYGPPEAVLREKRRYMRRPAFKVGPRREYLLPGQGLVGGQEHDGRALGVGRSRYL